MKYNGNKIIINQRESNFCFITVMFHPISVEVSWFDENKNADLSKCSLVSSLLCLQLTDDTLQLEV